MPRISCRETSPAWLIAIRSSRSTRTVRGISLKMAWINRRPRQARYGSHHPGWLLTVFREPRDGRCVGPSFRVRNDMADLSKNRVCCEHAVEHFVGSQGASRATGPAGLQCVSPQGALRLASSIGGLAYGGTDRPIFGTLSHEQIGRTRAYVITKWRQSKIQQVKETKVPPPRTHGKVGDPVGGQCSAVR